VKKSGSNWFEQPHGFPGYAADGGRCGHSFIKTGKEVQLTRKLVSLYPVIGPQSQHLKVFSPETRLEARGGRAFVPRKPRAPWCGRPGSSWSGFSDSPALPCSPPSSDSGHSHILESLWNLHSPFCGYEKPYVSHLWKIPVIKIEQMFSLTFFAIAAHS
jgi:hypothetical protein